MLAVVDNNPKKLCIFSIDNKLLLGVGVEHLLSNEADLCFVGPTSPDGATLLETINLLQPDVVILDQIYFLMLPLNLFIELLAYYPELKLIIVSAIDDRVQVYHKNEIRITYTVDLIRLISGSHKNWLQGIPYLFASYQLGYNQFISISN